ncbi:MAG: hypothetical protein K2J10_11500 [Muribaculaceae bacterium]|nr:hypothetical protein [Muribaculaceae bacterium]
MYIAFNEMSDMLAGRDSLSIKRAVYLAEWAYYEGKLDYKTDFCDEIDRIVKFIRSFHEINQLESYKTGMQMAISSYIVRPYSGNGYTPYTYDFDTFFMDDEPWERQFVSRTLKTHKGQCRSIPWMYKILANELNAYVSLAHAPRHSYIMYKDEDGITPEEWINLELTTNAMNPSWWIKQEFEICDSAVIVGTYMTPLTDIQTVACQMADLAFGYKEKFHRYDEFTYYCASRSLEFYPMNPNAWIIRGKSLERIIHDYLFTTGHVIDEYAAYLISLMEETKLRYDRTYMTEETEEIRKRRIQQAIESQKYLQEKTLQK